MPVQIYYDFLICGFSIFAVVFIIFAKSRSECKINKKKNVMAILEYKIPHHLETLCSHIAYPQFVLPLHKHVEYELMLFTQGSGKQFVGEGVCDFKAGDVALIGSNVPHLHLSDSQLNPKDSGENDAEYSEGQAIQFRPELFPVNMKDLPDYQQVYDLLSKSQYGIRFYDKGVYGDLLDLVEEFDKSSFTSRIICLLRMLDRLHSCTNYKLLSETPYNKANHQGDGAEPVNKVYTYLYNHFKEEVKLEDIANYVGQNPTALCRYFKQCTRKSIFQSLAEIRIGHSAKLLAYSSLPVSHVAFESGYNTMSHFISQFKVLMGRTPSEYREQIRR